MTPLPTPDYIVDLYGFARSDLESLAMIGFAWAVLVVFLLAALLVVAAYRPR